MSSYPGRNPDDFYDFDEVCRRLNIAEGRLLRLVREGEIRGFHEKGKKHDMVFEKTEIDSLAGEHGAHGKRCVL